MVESISPIIAVVNTILQLTARNIPLIVQAQPWPGSRLDNQPGLASREFKENHSEIHLVLAPDGQTLSTTYTWFNPGNRTAQGETTFSRISGGPGLEGSWKVVKRVEEPDVFYIAFPAPGQLYFYIDPMDYTWAGPLDGTFRSVQCTQLVPGTASAFKLTGPRRMDIQTKIDDKLAYLEKWEISEDGKTLTRTTWPPGQENKTSVWILEKE